MESSRGAVPALVAIALFVIVAAALALGRNSGTPFTDILYAEDGTVFFSDARIMGIEGILVPYAGYLHVVSRAVAATIALLPIGQVAAAYSIIAAVLVAFLALYVFFSSTPGRVVPCWPPP